MAVYPFQADEQNVPRSYNKDLIVASKLQQTCSNEATFQLCMTVYLNKNTHLQPTALVI